jgi:hypothetical protein
MTRWSYRVSRPLVTQRLACATALSRASTSLLSRSLALAFCCATGIGCSNDSPYELAEVTGKVTIDGQPFAEGKVMFAPVAKPGEINAGRSALARLKPDGTFKLGTYEPEDGAVVGDHWVTVIRIAPGPNSSTDEQTPMPAVPHEFKRVVMPRKVTVVSGQNTIDVSLTAAEMKQYAVYD